MKHTNRGRRAVNAGKKVQKANAQVAQHHQSMWDMSKENMWGILGSTAWFLAFMFAAWVVGEAHHVASASQQFTDAQLHALHDLHDWIFWGDFVSYAWAMFRHWLAQMVPHHWLSQLLQHRHHAINTDGNELTNASARH